VSCWLLSYGGCSFVFGVHSRGEGGFGVGGCLLFFLGGGLVRRGVGGVWVRASGLLGGLRCFGGGGGGWGGVWWGGCGSGLLGWFWAVGLQAVGRAPIFIVSARYRLSVAAVDHPASSHIPARRTLRGLYVRGSLRGSLLRDVICFMPFFFFREFGTFSSRRPHLHCHGDKPAWLRIRVRPGRTGRRVVR